MEVTKIIIYGLSSVGIFMLLWGVAMLIKSSIEYWQITLLIFGIILINIFTLWTAIIIFLFCIFSLAYVHAQKSNTIFPSIAEFKEIFVLSIKATALIVISALIVGAVLDLIASPSDSEISCGRSTPHNC